jgi:hypothetical protein
MISPILQGHDHAFDPFFILELRVLQWFMLTQHLQNFCKPKKI